LRFLVDAQLPPALARRIESLGYDAQHVFDVGLATASDDRIRRHAGQTAAVIVTKDEDFAVHRIMHPGPPIVWIRTGNTRRAELLRSFETKLSEIVAAIEAGETLVELS